jgi:L-asparaginase
MQSSAAPIPRVSLFTLGGTIATAQGEDGMQPRLTADDLARSLGDLDGVAHVHSESLRQLPSPDLRFADIAEVAQRIENAIAAGASGAVVTQGTDTLEETAFQLDVLLDLPQPVIVTGAMRNSTLAGADGPANLRAALRVAATPAAAGLGVLVVMNDEIHAARFVRKMHTHKPSAFASPGVGPLGWLAEDRVRIVVRPAESTLTVPWRGQPPEVPLITLAFSMDSRILQPWMDQLPAGLVVAALGAGHAPSTTVEALGSLASEIPVVLASRAGAGELFRGTYDYEGSETDLLRRGCICAGYLDPMKARVMLSLLLADGADRDRVVEAFARY